MNKFYGKYTYNDQMDDKFTKMYKLIGDETGWWWIQMNIYINTFCDTSLFQMVLT